MRLWIVLLVLLGCICAWAFQPAEQAKKGEQTTVTRTVGTRPGGVQNKLDIVNLRLENRNQIAMFGAGCFWGVEERFRQIDGVVATAVGYSGGHKANPTYKEVCYTDTGHAEVVLIEFDPEIVSYEQLLDLFWKNHDPTTLNRQGPDFGTQYRSAVFYADHEQKIAAESMMRELDASGRFGRPMVTEITKASTFWMAEEYHQQYCAKNGIAACPIK